MIFLQLPPLLPNSRKPELIHPGTQRKLPCVCIWDVPYLFDKDALTRCQSCDEWVQTILSKTGSKASSVSGTSADASARFSPRRATLREYQPHGPSLRFPTKVLDCLWSQPCEPQHIRPTVAPLVNNEPQPKAGRFMGMYACSDKVGIANATKSCSTARTLLSPWVRVYVGQYPGQQGLRVQAASRPQQRWSQLHDWFRQLHRPRVVGRGCVARSHTHLKKEDARFFSGSHFGHKIYGRKVYARGEGQRFKVRGCMSPASLKTPDIPWLIP